MAVNFNNNTNVQTAAQQTAGQQQQQQFTQPSNTQYQTLSQLMGDLNPGMSYTGSGDTLRKFKEVMEESVKSSRVANEYTMVTVDGPSEGLSLSAMVMAKTQGQLTVFYSFILAATVGRLQPTTGRNEYGDVSRPTTVSELYCDNYSARVADALARAINAQQCIDAGCMVIQDNITPEMAENIQICLYTGSRAIESEFNRENGKSATLKLNTINPQTTVMEGILDLRPGEASTCSGDPIARALSIDISLSERKADNNGYNNRQQDPNQLIFTTTMQMGSADGMIGLSPVDPQMMMGQMQFDPSQSWNPQYMQNLAMMQNRRFIATAHITNLTMVHGFSIEGALLALSAMTRLSEGNTCGEFIPALAAASRVNADRNIGALLYEVSEDAENTVIKDEDLEQFAFANVMPNLTYCLHCDATRPSGWVMETLRLASDVPSTATEDEKAINRAARLDLFNVANEMTGGALAKSGWTADMSIGCASDDVILMGYYEDENGRMDPATGKVMRHDIRNIDYLWWLNRFGKQGDMLRVQRWAETMVSTNKPLANRIQDRLNLLEEIGLAVTYTGYATPVNLNPKWLEAIRNAIISCGMQPRYHRFETGFREQVRVRNDLFTYQMGTQSTQYQYQNNVNQMAGYNNAYFNYAPVRY